MKKNIIKIVIGVILLVVFVLLISRLKVEDKPFNNVILSENNIIVNNTHPTYYDTILSVAMDEMGITGQRVVVNKLTDGAKSSFDGTLKAHVRYHEGVFYIFSDDLDRKESIEVLCHEVIHIQQYVNNILSFEDGFVFWLGEPIDLNSREYEQRPWEIDAFNREGDLIKLVENILYSK
jgi:hypothetical protein